VLFWLLEFVLPIFVGYGMALIPARLSGEAVWDVPGVWAVPAWLTPLSMTFVHGGLGHLLLNMVFLVFVGRTVEPLLGTGRFLALYFASAVAGAILEAALAPESIVPHVGASGAIAGVFAAHAMIYGRRRPHSSEWKHALQLAAVWIGLQLLIGFVFNSGGAAGGIAIWAHVGGFLAGLVLALPLARDALKAR
jgi:membrane associated rhomboid family serine protease